MLSNNFKRSAVPEPLAATPSIKLSLVCLQHCLGLVGKHDSNNLAYSNALIYASLCVGAFSTLISYADKGAHRIRKLDAATGLASTVTGVGSQACTGNDGTPAGSTGLWFPQKVGFFNGSLYIADTSCTRIRKIEVATSELFSAAAAQSRLVCSSSSSCRSAAVNIMQALLRLC